MSMNIYITGQRKIWYQLNGNTLEDIQVSKPFNAIQTITKETNHILEQGTVELQKEAYIDVVLCTLPRQRQVPVYDVDDFFGEFQVLKYDIEDTAAIHVERFENWCEWCEKNGYEIIFSKI